jgi:DNA-binding IclR family transcriptional regulator
MAAESHAMGILQRSSNLIQLLAERGPLSTAAVAEQIGLPRPSVYRLADALMQARLVEATPGGKLRVSLRWLKLSDAAREGMREWSRARLVLDGLASRTGQTVYLTVPQAECVICIDWSPGRAISVLALKPGRTLPLYAGAAGRVTLAYRPEPLDDYLQAAPFPPLTDHTLCSAEELRADVEATISRGYSVSDEDVTPGIGALGAPLVDRDGLFRGAVSIAGLAEDLRVRRGELSAELIASADVLSASADSR